MRADPRRTRRAGRVALLGLVLAAIAAAPAPATDAAFTGRAENPSNALTAHPDWTAPITSRLQAWKPEGGTPGFVRSPGGYRIIAHVVDDPSGNAPAGVGSVTSPNGPSTLTATAFTLQGLAYTHQGPLIPIAAGRAAATLNISSNAADLSNPVNTAATFNSTVVLESTAPVATALTITNGAGATANLPDRFDVLLYTWGEVIEPHTVQPTTPATTPPSGWTGAAAASVTVRITNGTGGANDTLTVVGTNLGTVNLGNAGYVTGDTDFNGSTMTWTSTGVQVTLGFASRQTFAIAANAAYAWTPSAAVIDRAGNPSTTAVVNETGGGDPNF